MTANCEPMPQYDDRQYEGRLDKGEGFRADEPTARGEQRAGKPGESGADGKSSQLDARRAEAQRAAGDLVFAQRFVRAPAACAAGG